MKPGGIILAASLCGPLIYATCFLSIARGSGFILRQDEEPPPMKFIPSAAREQLSEARDPKARTRLSLEMAEERLSKAAELTNSKSYEAASSELGIYEALVEDALHYLQTTGKTNNKTRDLYKRIEQTLREQGPRLEAIRRLSPSGYASHVKAAYAFIRHLRTEALDAFYGNTVLRDESPGDKEKTSHDKMKQSGPKPSGEKP